MTQTETKTFFNDEVRVGANRLRLVVEELEVAADDLRTARARHQRAELEGDRSELVSSMRSLAECEAVHAALGKQRDTLAGILAASLCENFYEAKQAASRADMSRRTAGMEAAMPHIAAALEAVRSAVAAFNGACGGSDLVSAMGLDSERKSLIADLSADERRGIPEPHLIGSRHLCPPQLGDIERVLAALLP